MRFVEVVDGECAKFGVGKLVERKGDVCVVEYFDAPIATPQRFHVETASVGLFTLPGQTRVYHFDQALGAWEIGRLLDDHGDTQLVRFPNGVTKHLDVASIFVRWALPIDDPTPFLGGKINETPRYSDGRAAFVQALIAQRAAAMGISALLSSAIELEAHQVEVVRRVLQDPVQRYLLADEVGLGKTIEAGVLIRQCALDGGADQTILVLAPGPLVAQWREELQTKFFLGPLIDRSLHVVSLDDVETARPLLARAAMLVIDEAHLLTRARAVGRQGLYEEVAQAAVNIERLLLLSATPALHNERGFLEMLHLLDPQTYLLDGVAEFQQKIANRQSLAEIVAGLRPENALFLDDTVERLRTLFPEDDILQELVGVLSESLAGVPEEDDPVLVDAIAAVHAHLSEVYRLHRRIVRHRRRSIGGLTPERAGVLQVAYPSQRAARLTEAVDEWRFAEANAAKDDGPSARLPRALAMWRVLERALQYPASGAGAVAVVAKRRDLVGDLERFSIITDRLAASELFADRAEALVTALAPLLSGKSQFVVFCSDVKTADVLAARLRTDLDVLVDRHSPSDEGWRSFNTEIGHPILVCDQRAEEGLNLQGGRKIVVHFDLPLNPNRIEQRLGRVDRYGAGDAVRSLVLTCQDSPYEMAWFEYLNSALKIFDRSVASLQYTIDATMRSVGPGLFTDGPEAFDDLTAQDAGEDGGIEREIRDLDQQDALDSLGAPPTGQLDVLSDVDEDWRAIEAATLPWIEQVLQFRRSAEGGGAACGDGVFRFRYSTDQHHTLVPLATFVSNCGTALDIAPGGKTARSVQTVACTYRRRTALSRQGRAARASLLRYGDPFSSGMWDLTQSDDRGRSSAMWRFDPDYVAHGSADVFFRFDFLVEADLDPALSALREQSRSSPTSKAAITRRGDMALPPFFTTIWLDRELNVVSDPKIQTLLSMPYAPDARSAGGRDYNLNNERWRRLSRLDVPEVGVWSELCANARHAAEEHLRRQPALTERLALAHDRAKAVSKRRLGQLKARAVAVGGEDVELADETLLSTRLGAGLQQPRVRPDAVGAVFLSGDMSATLVVGKSE